MSSMKEPRDLVCDVCWDGFFNTQAYQDFLNPPPSDETEQNEFEPREIIQQTTSQNVRDNCSFINIRKDIASSESRPKPGFEGPDGEPIVKCNWCEYLGFYSCCELDEEEKAPEPDDDLVEISFKTVRVDWSTPQSAPGAGAKVFMLSLDRRNRKTRDLLVGNGSMHHAYTTATDSAAELVLSRPVKQNISGEEATKQMKAWISECESHRCGAGGGFYKETDLPTRLIDVGVSGSKQPRIVDTQGFTGIYASLSYCWGQQSGTVLYHDNLQKLQGELKVEGLAKTIQDAIFLTRHMSIPYLWVDSLCIIQDDETEKAKEMSRMQDIYSRSAVTIIAARANSAHEGFLTYPEGTVFTRPGRQAVVVPVRISPGNFGTMSLIDLNTGICYDESDEPISRRAWTTQEQLLAQRKLIFSQHNSTMTWSCPHSPMTRAFGDSMHLPYWPGNFSGIEEDFLRETLNLLALAPDPAALSADNSSDKDKALGCWLRLVTVYSQRSASLQVDKLNALAGIAARCYAPLLGPGYFAGMWEYGLLRQLAWQISDGYSRYSRFTHGTSGGTRPLLETEQSRAPSWSWASTEGGTVEYDRFPNVEKHDGHFRIRREEEGEWMSEVISVTTTPRFAVENPFGEIDPGSGSIVLRTKLKRAWFHPWSGSIFRKSCAPTPSRGSTSYSDSFSEEQPQLDESVVEEQSGKSDDLEAENTAIQAAAREDKEDVNDESEVADNLSEGDDADQSWNQVPTFDMITHQVIAGPVGEYVSPFKRVFRRTASLPLDSDSEYDSASDTEETPSVPQHANEEPADHNNDRDRTWWWLVNASIDEKPATDRNEHSSWLDQDDCETDHLEPFVVYMLPLVVTIEKKDDNRPLRPRDETVRGLLLVKQKEIVGIEESLDDGTEEGSGERHRKPVLFKRVGRFSGCPKNEFAKLITKDVTIV